MKDKQIQNAGRIINDEAMDKCRVVVGVGAKLQLGSNFIFPVLAECANFYEPILGYSWYLFLHFPNFESHSTVSGEHRAALVKTFFFFLVKLIFLQALVKTSLDGTIITMGQCYMGGDDCKKINQRA